MKKTLYLFIVLVVIFSSTCFTYATSEAELDEINKKIDEKKEEIDSVEKQMSATMQEVDSLIGEISGYENEITELESEIAELDTSIANATEELEQAEIDCQEQQEALEQRLIVLYEAGETSFLDVLLGSDSLTEFISNYYIITTIAEYDTALLENLENTKQKIETMKTDLETNKQTVEEKKGSIEAKQIALENAKTVKEQYASQLSEEEKQLQKELEEFEEDRKIIENQIRQASSGSNNGPYTGGTMMWPAPGVYYVSCEFRGYRGHDGMDIAGSSGSTIVAANDGVVRTSTALKYSDGTYRSYGEYIIIDHGGKVVTLYAHGYPGSRMVHEGDTVKRGQAIMKMGTTGNSTGNHLHFEVRVNDSPQNPRNYVY